jgi:hypothetical protein
LLLFSKKQAFLPLALTAAAYRAVTKKEVKNFCELGWVFPDRLGLVRKSFLVLFFKKEHAFYTEPK